MATRSDVRRIALALPDARESETDFAFSVPNKGKLKGFAWVWKERVDPKKARVPNPAVLAIRVANVGQRNAMIAAEPKKFFTEPHYEGFPAVLVRIAEVSVGEMRVLLEEGRRCLAPAKLRTATTTATATPTPQRGGAGTQRVRRKIEAGIDVDRAPATGKKRKPTKRRGRR